MKKITIVLAFILAGGVGFSRAGEIETLKASSGVSDLQKAGFGVDIGGVHVDVPLPGHPQAPQPGHGPQQDNHNQPGSQPGSWHPQPGPQPDPWHPQPNPWATQIFNFQSGEFSFNNEAQDSMDEAVRQLNAAGYTIMENRLNWTQYTLVFTGPARAHVEKYTSGQYNSNNEAKAGMDQAVNTMKQSGKIILEARLNWTVFTISYLDGDGGGHGENWNAQRLTLQSGEFSSNNEAKDSMDEAVRQLNAAGCAIIESRLNWTQYTIIFTASHAQIQSYTSGQYNSNNEAKAGMAQAVNTMKQSGKIILETRLNWTVFTISYLENAHH